MMLGAMVWFGYVYARAGANLLVVNEGGLAIAELKIEAAGTVFHLGTLNPAEQKSIKLRNYGDAGWKVTGCWAGAEQILFQVGYLTGGANFDDRLRLQRSGPIYSSHMWNFWPPN